jgi:hypothetical protein
MKKSTLINKFEAKIDASVEALYDARDLIEDTGEIDTYFIDEAIEEVEEMIAKLSNDVSDAVEDIEE